jgi:hypothetical protein
MLETYIPLEGPYAAAPTYERGAPQDASNVYRFISSMKPFTINATISMTMTRAKTHMADVGTTNPKMSI